MEWSEQEDLTLAETVLRYLREGIEQISAFDEVGKKLNKSTGECAFRWNTVVRHNYTNAIAYAKKQRIQQFHDRIESRKDTIKKIAAEAMEKHGGAFKKMAGVISDDTEEEQGEIIYSQKADYSFDPYAEDELKQAQNLIKKLYNLLGQSADLDFKLWQETEKYCKEKGLK